MSVALGQRQISGYAAAIAMSVAHRGERAQNLDAVLSGEGMRRVHAAEVGEAGGRVSRSPAQDVAQLRRVGVNGVPRHQELGAGEERPNAFTVTMTKLRLLKGLTLTASGTSLTAPGSILTSRVTSATMASFLNLYKHTLKR